MFFSLQSGYIDGPILNTFHTNLVVLPAVMEYMQYGFIALGLATIIIAAVVHYKAKVRLSHCSRAAVCCVFITACCRVMHVVPLTERAGESTQSMILRRRVVGFISNLFLV